MMLSFSPGLGTGHLGGGVYEKSAMACTVVGSLTREDAEIWVGGLRKILDPLRGVYEKFSCEEGGV